MPLIDLALVNNVWTLKLSMIQTVGLAVITLFIGTWINKHSKFLQRMCMPAPAVGALPFAFLTAILSYYKILNITFEGSLQTFLMLAFFTTIGLMASLKVLKKGGIFIIFFFLACAVWIVVQNTAGIMIAKALGIEPIIGIMAGSVSMIGGLWYSWCLWSILRAITWYPWYRFRSSCSCNIRHGSWYNPRCACR